VAIMEVDWIRKWWRKIGWLVEGMEGGGPDLMKEEDLVNTAKVVDFRAAFKKKGETDEFVLMKQKNKSSFKDYQQM